MYLTLPARGRQHVNILWWPWADILSFRAAIAALHGWLALLFHQRINNLLTNIDRCQPAFKAQHCVNNGPCAGGVWISCFSFNKIDRSDLIWTLLIQLKLETSLSLSASQKLGAWGGRWGCGGMGGGWWWHVLLLNIGLYPNYGGSHYLQRRGSVLRQRTTAISRQGILKEWLRTLGGRGTPLPRCLQPSAAQ